MFARWSFPGARSLLTVALLAVSMPSLVNGVDWKNQIVFPDEPFCSPGINEDDPSWIKFTIKLDDPGTIYFQDSQLYVLHYDFATALLDPFIGMTPAQFNQVTLFEANQLAVLGVVFMPPVMGDPPAPAFTEYGIQFVRYDPYTKQEIADMFNVVKASFMVDPNVQAFYFPTYEQYATAEANRDWFEDQGIPVSSPARWAQGNLCYSEGWALGQLKFFGAEDIEDAYRDGLLEPNDILLADSIPAEIPFVAGIISLSPSTPSSHVAILAKTYGIPFVHLALVEDANRAQELVGHKIVLRAFEYGPYGLGTYDVRIIDVNGVLTEQQIEEILALKAPPTLDISPIANSGTYSADTQSLTHEDINRFGGKASNFGILRTSIQNNSPVAVAFSFNLWNDFLDQPLVPCDGVTIDANGHLLFWADKDVEQGSSHTNFKLQEDGEYIGLYDKDGSTLIDGLTFGSQTDDISHGRETDGNDNWVFFSGGTASPNQPNSSGGGGPTEGLFINEFMADNEITIADANAEYDDWIEIYNASSTPINLGGMYLTDDMNDPTKWMIPPAITGSTLREEIANRISGYTYPPSDMAALSADLSAIRSIFKNTNTTSFSQQLQDTVIATLQDAKYGFDPNQKIRFRSSTNVEDSEQFTGAGLYDSYSGCLADDLDHDDDGPSICDPCRANERGVFRAIRKVFASFYNDNAFLERLRHGVSENEVGMALLVHHSFPDEIELANGVATVEKGFGLYYWITLVTQLGATSVSNPEGGSIPEEVFVGAGLYGNNPSVVRWSSLMPVGDTVMVWQDDYTDLSELLVAAAGKFEQITGKTEYVLDFEYKKVAPGGAAMPAGGLVIKQIREIPQPNDTPSITPFLINEPTQYCTFQGEYTSVFANHRLKLRWTLETENTWLTSQNLLQSFYADTYLEYQDTGQIRTVQGKPALWPFAYHDFDATDSNDGWLMHHLANPRNCQLQTNNIPNLVSTAQSPLLVLRDMERNLSLSVEYDQPVISVDYEGNPTTTSIESIYLCPTPQPQPGDLLNQRSFYDDVNYVNITTSFYWPPIPDGIMIYTAPLSRFVETVIDGYTTEPIILHNYYSQTYSPNHHNFGEHFLFEPRLEPGISQGILDELQAQDIRLIYMYYGFPTGSIIRTYGFGDESFLPGDFEPDGDVDFRDYCLFATRWLDTICDDCGGADLTGDGRVDGHDLRQLTEQWLEGT